MERVALTTMSGFSEAMRVSDVQNAANYALYSSSGAQVLINSVVYNPGTFTATVNYNGGNTTLLGAVLAKLYVTLILHTHLARLWPFSGDVSEQFCEVFE